MQWTIFLILATFSLVAYNFLQKVSASKIGPLAAIPFLAIGIIIVTIGSFILQKSTPRHELFSWNGAIFAVGVGIFWGIAQIFVYLMYKNNAPLSVGFPLLLGGVTIIITFLSYFLLGEKVTFFKIAGIITLIIGYWILTIEK